ncbi:small heat shock protein, chloroplastic-like isoform X1 [Phoenix dactylifera]|uniref:Small heat shock protein, chloroplastic-like isoform X1 n=1 Tax=Phoenix dactylifera TaxID=42345 RepID=A0A8B7BIU3_PHODC|nr:small heat shock protein, chloroplastic-like isoform X1 [Phoenix dactylifera]
MAAMIAIRRAPVSKLLEKLLVSPARPSAAAGSRLFNTNTRLLDLDDNRSLDVDRRRDDLSGAPRRRGDSSFFPGIFPGNVRDPFTPARSLSQVLNLMDQMLDNPFAAATQGAIGGFRRGWEAREDGDALHLRIDMPGLGKEHVKVWAEQNTLIIKGEGEKETEEEESGRRYSSRIDLPPEAYQIDQIRAEMKNGVLKVVVPKVKAEERKDVFQINIE